MKFALDNVYCNMTDKELVDLSIKGNDEAILYLLYVRYEKDLKFYAMRYYDSLEYLEELTHELFIRLKGTNADWQPLDNFQWRSSFRTWLCRVASNLFLEKRPQMIGLNSDRNSNGTNDDDLSKLPEPQPEPVNEKLVMILEALNRMEDDEYRFILIKELEGYNHKEIAEMLVARREKKNIVKYYNGNIVVPDASSVDRDKARAINKLKVIVEQIKQEWYGNE